MLHGWSTRCSSWSGSRKAESTHGSLAGNQTQAVRMYLRRDGQYVKQAAGFPMYTDSNTSTNEHAMHTGNAHGQ